MKKSAYFLLILLTLLCISFVACILWPGTSTGMVGAFLYAIPSKYGREFNPYDYQESVLSIARRHGFSPVDSFNKLDIRRDSEEILIPPLYERKFSSKCTAILYLCVRSDHSLAIYIRYPEASMLDSYRIRSTMESIRKELRPLQEAINEKKR